MIHDSPFIIHGPQFRFHVYFTKRYIFAKLTGMINFDEFQKVDLRVAKILTAEKVEGSDKLVRLEVACPEPACGESVESVAGMALSTDATDLPALPTGQADVRQIVAGIGKAYEPENLIGKEIIIVANLEPRQFTLRQSSGQVVLESNGMLLAARDADGLPILIAPERLAPEGTKIS